MCSMMFVVVKDGFEVVVISGRQTRYDIIVITNTIIRVFGKSPSDF